MLLDEEAKIAMEKRALISRITLEVDEILLRENFTMGDWAEIADLINARSIKHFSQIKIKTIKENYGEI